MGAIRRSKTKRRTRCEEFQIAQHGILFFAHWSADQDLDQVHADLHSTKHLNQYKNSKAADDLPGLGQHYCVECAKWFESEHNLVQHRRGKNHLRRVRLLREEPYSQREAEAAVGLGVDNGPVKEAVVDTMINEEVPSVEKEMEVELEEADGLRLLHYPIMATYNKVDLFGGAITVDLPDGYADVSDIRQVPDHQEVYLDKDGFASIIFDLTEQPDSVTTDEAALKLHLDDIFDSDDDVKLWYQNTTRLLHFPEQTPIYTIFKTKHFPQEASGGSRPLTDFRATPIFTGVLVTIVRLKAQTTDIVITINVPHIKGNYDEGRVDLERGQLGPLLDSALAHQDRIFRTFEVKDWNLFVQE
ncbi:hypothetical protein FGG08_001769 [Glutinoglossum americanum]|uniref:C2H2-type domain-containing protein n=1 Tax=Glutinoglossum americanum TaxID=1670608 RepID=A0A9P8ICZ4_9PEZI|nr:hypothetical protein FGG08_001769 [Glutinoglossum americanum]